MLVELRDYTKIIQGVTVLDKLNLTLESGKIYGVKGKNGSGKTMLFRAISGLIHLTSGQVDVFGQRIGVDVDFPRSLGLVLESAGFWDESTGLRNLTMLASIRGVAGEAEARAALARVGLAPDDDRPFSAYSMGMRQRLTIAQAIMEAPELLILDEPTNALDVDGIETVAKIVREERERGCTVLVACHNEPALEALFEAQGDSICAVMLEPIQGESGVHPCSPEFMEAVRRLTAERRALMICDEVQCGIYRTGKPFGFQNYDVVPDIVSIAKGVASGFPCGMCAARGEVAAAFKPGDHGSTFGGSNLAVAAAEATLSEIQKENLAANAIEVGAYLREQLSALPQVTEVRGMGLMLAADLAEDGKGAPDVVLDGLSAGLLLNATGAHTLRFLPPLVCSRADVDALIEKLGGIL